MTEVHKCPVCNGSGLVSIPPYVAGDQPTFASSTVGPWPCRACLGLGYLTLSAAPEVMVIHAKGCAIASGPNTPCDCGAQPFPLRPLVRATEPDGSPGLDFKEWIDMMDPDAAAPGTVRTDNAETLVNALVRIKQLESEVARLTALAAEREKEAFDAGFRVGKRENCHAAAATPAPKETG